MPDHTSTLQTAGAMARALVERDADINELAKFATYCRTHLDGRKFFRLLETMLKDGHLVRSGRTREHYQNIQEVCCQHLEPYRQALGAQAQECAEILGWTVRLMRYHKAMGTTPTERPASSPARSGVARPTAGKEPPALGDVKVPLPPPPPPVTPAKDVVTREVVTLVEDAKNRKAQVETKDGARLVCTDLPAYPPAKQGARCRADITRREDKALRAIFKRWE